MKRALFLAASAAVASVTLSASAASLTMGNLVVVQVGDGVTTISSNSNAAATKLREYTTAGGFVQNLALPVAASGSNRPLTLSGSATSEGFLSLSADGNYLALGGYAAAPGTAGVVTAAPTAVARVIGRIDMNGNIDTTTALDDAFSGSNIRSAAALDGNTLYAAGNGGTGLGGSAGVRYAAFGSTTGSIRLNDSSSNMRVVNIYKGQLYTSASTGTFLGVSTVGTGAPTSGSQTNALVALPGMPTTGSHSAYDFWFKDDNTLYIADDGGAASGGGIQKWVLNSGTWSLAYTLLNTGSATTAVRGLAGTVDTSGNAVLFATTNEGTANKLITVTDTGSGATSTVLATADSLTAFRGVEFLPIPEPTTASTLAIAGLFAAKRRRR